MNKYWPKLIDLFDSEDGSLPDVFINGLSGDQVCSIYSWIMSQATIYDEPMLWHDTKGENVPIKSVAQPALAVVSGDIVQFRHGLTNLQIAGVELLGLTICISSDQISFDYQTGDDWDAPQVAAFLELLAGVIRLAPEATITHQFEGSNETTPGFTETVYEYIHSN